MGDMDKRYEMVDKKERRPFIMCKCCGKVKKINAFRVIEIKETEDNPSMTKYNDFCIVCDLRFWVKEQNKVIGELDEKDYQIK